MIHKLPRRNVLTSLLAVALIASLAATYAVQAESKPDEARHDKSKVEQDKPKAEKPALLAIDFYADWCGFCAQMKESRAEVRERHGDDAVLFLTLDHTDRESKQPEFHAALLGLDDVWEEHGGRTGRMLLIDPESKKIVKVLTHEHDTNAMSQAIAAHLGE